VTTMRDLMMIVEGVVEHGTSAASPAEQFIASASAIPFSSTHKYAVMAFRGDCADFRLISEWDHGKCCLPC